MTSQPGFDGQALVEVLLKDPEGDGKRELKAWRRVGLLESLRYASPPRITQAQYDAGNKFQSDAERMEVRCSCSAEFMAGGHRTLFEIADSVLEAARSAAEARARLRGALGWLGPAYELFAVWMLLHRATYTSACKAAGFRRRDGHMRLVEVLEKLANFYCY